jgi:hypothetical protein
MGRRKNKMQIIYIHMYINAKMITVETILDIRGWEMKENSGGGELKYDVFDIL